MTETRAQLYTSSWQAPYHSFRRQRQNSFILLPLLSPKSFATLRGPHEVIAFCRKPLAGSLMISAKVPCFNHTEEATLPLRWLCQLPYAQACGAPRPGLSVADRVQVRMLRMQNISLERADSAEVEILAKFCYNSVKRD